MERRGRSIGDWPDMAKKKKKGQAMITGLCVLTQGPHIAHTWTLFSPGWRLQFTLGTLITSIALKVAKNHVQYYNASCLRCHT